MSNVLRNIPSVSELLESPPLKSLVNRFNRNVVVSGVRRFLDEARMQVQSAAASVHVPLPSELAQRIADWIAQDQQSSLTPVVNATGIILHAQLGGAPLAEEAIQAVAAASRGYTNLEINLATGERCPRVAGVEELLTQLTASEAATVVNNHAAATVLILAALGTGRELIVSRGQLLETDDEYRLPQIISASGAILREVGTTNVTRINDYAAALTPATAAILHVHASNFDFAGHAAQTSLADLVTLGRKHNVPVIDDLGRGGLVDLSRYGILGEPLAATSIRTGADLVLVSGDKLLGGPTCGIILGRRPLIEQIAAHPLMRAFRLDKLTLAALSATLRLYQDPELAERSIPLLSLLATPLENLRQRAERIAPQIAATGVATVEILPGQTPIAGESLPHQILPTICLALTPCSGTVDQLATALRTGTPAVIGRIHDGRLYLDLRSVPPRDDLQLVAAFESRKVAHSGKVGHSGPE